ncbi:MAG: NYN domain-containing protein [Pirellulales bacterium]
MTSNQPQNVRIGVFYDGNFLYRVSSYYKYGHEKKRRLSMPGLQEFIRDVVAQEEQVATKYVQIVDAHYFRGRLSARELESRQLLYYERVFDDVLMSAGILTHYLPLRRGGEKGIDVWLALEAFELTQLKQFDVVVLVAGDSDFLPLLPKLYSLGARVMVLGWNVRLTDSNGDEHESVTSKQLLDAATYQVAMHEIIDDPTRQDDPLLVDLFVEPRQEAGEPTIDLGSEAEPALYANKTPVFPPIKSLKRQQGKILQLKNVFGFIESPNYPNNVFFHELDLLGCTLNDLSAGMPVSFDVEIGPKGPCAKKVRIDK